MVVGVVVAIVGIIVVMVLLSRMENRNKAMAKVDLAQDREPSGTHDILELVNQEVRDTGIGSLPGADGVDPVVLLKVWKRDNEGCAKGHGWFVLDEGIAPGEAEEDTLNFECERDPDVAS
jgi:hypothetical protein